MRPRSWARCAGPCSAGPAARSAFHCARIGLVRAPVEGSARGPAPCAHPSIPWSVIHRSHRLPVDRGVGSVEEESASVEDTPSPGNPSRMFVRKPLRARSGRHRTCSHALLREAGRLGTRIRTADTSLLEDRCGSRVTRLPGSEREAGSVGSVTSTGQPKGPCDSYSQGPFTYFGHRLCHEGVGPGNVSTGLNWSRSLCITRSFSVDERRAFLWTAGNGDPEKFPRNSCAAPGDDIERSLTSSSGRAGSLGDEGLYGATASLLEDRCGSRVTRLPGSEGRVDRSGASPVPVEPKGPWDSYSRGPFTHFGAGSGPGPPSTAPQESPRDLCMNRVDSCWTGNAHSAERTAFSGIPRGMRSRSG